MQPVTSLMDPRLGEGPSKACPLGILEPWSQNNAMWSALDTRFLFPQDLGGIHRRLSESHSSRLPVDIGDFFISLRFQLRSLTACDRGYSSASKGVLVEDEVSPRRLETGNFRQCAQSHFVSVRNVFRAPVVHARSAQ